MTEREIFIEVMDNMIENNVNVFGEDKDKAEKAMAFYLSIKNMPVVEKKIITEKGTAIIRFMKENGSDSTNVFTAKMIGEGIGTTGKAAAGSLRKLVTDGFVEKIGAAGSLAYKLTDKGVNFLIEE